MADVIDEDRNKSWQQIMIDRELRECIKCTSVISNSLSYGRRSSKLNPNICECCEYYE